jgi:hypothetical protein
MKTVNFLQLILTLCLGFGFVIAMFGNDLGVYMIMLSAIGCSIMYYKLETKPKEEEK